MSNIIQTIFKTKLIEEEFKTISFIFQYENKQYMITTHHFIPFNENEIYSLYGNTKTKIKIITRPIWNELLILDPPKFLKYEIIKIFRKTKPLEKESLFLGVNKIKCTMIGIKYFKIVTKPIFNIRG